MEKLNIKILILFTIANFVGYHANAQVTSLKIGDNPTVKESSSGLD